MLQNPDIPDVKRELKQEPTISALIHPNQQIMSNLLENEIHKAKDNFFMNDKSKPKKICDCYCLSCCFVFPVQCNKMKTNQLKQQWFS